MQNLMRDMNIIHSKSRNDVKFKKIDIHENPARSRGAFFRSRSGADLGIKRKASGSRAHPARMRLDGTPFDHPPKYSSDSHRAFLFPRARAGRLPPPISRMISVHTTGFEKSRPANAGRLRLSKNWSDREFFKQTKEVVWIENVV